MVAPCIGNPLVPGEADIWQERQKWRVTSLS